MSTEHGDNELELGPEDILVDGLIKKGLKNQGELEVAIGDGMEFTIHGDLKSKNKKTKTLMNSIKVLTTASDLLAAGRLEQAAVDRINWLVSG